jgi:hypothetical protein
MELLAARAKAGTTVIAVTHHLGNVDQASRILILGHGEVVWFGSRIEALVHFNVHRLTDIYLAIEDNPPGYWSNRWRERETEEHAALQTCEQDSGSSQPAGAVDEQEKADLSAVYVPGFFPQCVNFLRRELETCVREPLGLSMALLLPLVLGLIVLIGFSTVHFENSIMLTRFLDPGEKEVLADAWGEVREAISTDNVADQDASVPGQIRVFLDSQPKMLEQLRQSSTEGLIRAALTDKIPLAPYRQITDPAGSFKWLALMSICMVILGFVSGFREIVKERPMLDIERRHGLRFAAYVIAKVAALAIVLAVQVMIFRSTVELGFMLREAIGGEVPASIYRRSPLFSATCNWLAALACGAIGLIVSACVRSTDKGVLAVPLLITPQILLGATIIPIKEGVLKVCAMLFSPLYWAYRGCRSEGDGVPTFWQNLGPYDPAPWIPLTALVTQIVFAALITILVLCWQERRLIGRYRPLH